MFGINVLEKKSQLCSLLEYDFYSITSKKIHGDGILLWNNRKVPTKRENENGT